MFKTLTILILALLVIGLYIAPAQTKEIVKDTGSTILKGIGKLGKNAVEYALDNKDNFTSAAIEYLGDEDERDS
jgi:hypothetical protein